MLDKDGFKRKTFDDLMTDGKAKAKELFGENVNLSKRSPVGILLNIYMWFLSILWMVAEKVYLSAFVSSAEGVSLDRLGVFAGIKRQVAAYARGTLDIVGTPGYTVNPGLLVQKTGGGMIYVVTNSVTLDGSGHGSTTIEAVNLGSAGNAAAGEITTLVNADASITSVTNSAAIENGDDREEDDAYRAKFSSSRAARGSANINSTIADLLALSGVRAAQVEENETDAVDGSGRPAHSFETYVLGGDVTEIAKAIYDNKPAGIRTWGSETQTVTDLSGTARTIRFSRPTTVPIFADLQITTSSAAPSDVADQVRNAVVKYIGGEATDATVYAGATMGEDVLWAKVIRAAFTVTGVENVHGGIGTVSGTTTDADIVIAPQQVAQIDASDIEVTVS